MDHPNFSFDEFFLQEPDFPLVVTEGRRVLRSEMARLTGKLCDSIRDTGVRRMALVSQPVERIVAALIAAQRTGTDVVLVRNRAENVEQSFATWKVDSELLENFTVARLDTTADAGPGGKIVITTSGTTGVPKAAAYSLDRLLGRIKVPREQGQPAAWLLTYNPASFAGLQVILTALVGGGTLCVPNGYDVLQIAAAAWAFRPTHVSATPTLWRGILLSLGEARATQLPLMRITLGGEAVDQDILTRLARLFPQAAISHIYASTEAGAVFTVQDKRAGFPSSWLQSGIAGSQLRINGNNVLEVMTAHGMNGYLGAAAPQANGWIATGDVVEIVGDRVHFVGREDFVINVGGAKVWPEAVEAILRSAPGIAEAYVYGKRNPISGAIVAADIVLEPDADAGTAVASVRSFASNLLQRHEMPQRFSIVPAIQRGDTNKKARLR